MGCARLAGVEAGCGCATARTRRSAGRVVGGVQLLPVPTGGMMKERSGGWRITFKDERANLDVLEVQKLLLGVALGGVSPRFVAMSIRQALELEAE